MQIKIHHIPGRGVALILHQNTAVQTAPDLNEKWYSVTAASAALLTEDGQGGRDSRNVRRAAVSAPGAGWV